MVAYSFSKPFFFYISTRHNLSHDHSSTLNKFGVSTFFLVFLELITLLVHLYQLLRSYTLYVAPIQLLSQYPILIYSRSILEHDSPLQESTSSLLKSGTCSLLWVGTSSPLQSGGTSSPLQSGTSSPFIGLSLSESLLKSLFVLSVNFLFLSQNISVPLLLSLLT